jgi:hypothetical protein
VVALDLIKREQVYLISEALEGIVSSIPEAFRGDLSLATAKSDPVII